MKEHLAFSLFDFADEKIDAIQEAFEKLCEEKRPSCKARFFRDKLFGEASILPPLLPRQIDLTLAQRIFLGRNSDVVVVCGEPWSAAKAELLTRLKREVSILVLVTKDDFGEESAGTEPGVVVIEGDDTSLIAKHLFFLTSFVEF